MGRKRECCKIIAYTNIQHKLLEKVEFKSFFPDTKNIFKNEYINLS